MKSQLIFFCCFITSILIYSSGKFTPKENYELAQDAFEDNDLKSISNPISGQSFQVDSGNKEYYVNALNEYISSDELFYDPNNDNSVNHESWTKMSIEN